MNSSNSIEISFGENKDIFTSCQLNNIGTEGRIMSVNEKFIAFSWIEKGEILVVDSSQQLELNNSFPRIKGSQIPILDLEFSPFNNNILCSSHSNGSVFLWKIPENGLNENIVKESLVYKEHKKNVNFVNFNPCVQDAICTAESFGKIHIWNAEKGKKYIEYSSKGIPTSVQWNPEGKLIGASTKVQSMNISDPRTKAIIFDEKISESYIIPKFSWIDDHSFVSLNAKSNKKLFLKLWDIRKLKGNEEEASIQIKETIIKDMGIYTPFVDRESKLIFLTSQNDPSIDIYDYSEGKLIKINCCECEQKASNSILFNRKNLNKNESEIDRLVRYCDSNNTISYVSFYLQRKTNDTDYILYPPKEYNKNKLAFDQWINGKNLEKNIENNEEYKNGNDYITKGEKNINKLPYIHPNDNRVNKSRNILRRHSKNISNENDKMIKDLKAKIEDLENKNNKIEKEYKAEMENKINELNKIKNEQEENIKSFDDLNKSNLELQNKNKELEDKYNEINQKYNELKSNNELQNNSILELKQNINDINQKYNEEIKKNEFNNEKLNEINNKYSIESSKNKELESNYSELNKKYNEENRNKNEEIKELKEKIDEKENENKKLKEKIEEKELKIKEQEESIRNLENEKEELNEIKDKREKEVENKFKNDLQVQIEKIKSEEENKINTFKKEYENSLKQKYDNKINSEISKIQKALFNNIEDEIKKKNIEFKKLYEKENKRDKYYNEIMEMIKNISNPVIKNENIIECKTIHYGVKCQKCFRDPIIGYRYKCSICNNYNLCEKCENENLISEDHSHFFIKMRNAIEYYKEKGYEENKSNDIVKKNIKNISKKEYSFECLNDNNLIIETLEGRSEEKLELILRNNGEKTWPKYTTKLTKGRETTLSLKNEEIILEPQNPGETKEYKIILKELDNNKAGKYKLSYDFYVNNDYYETELEINVIIKENKNNEIYRYKKNIKEFRDNFNLSENDYTDERLLDLLKKNNFQFESAFISLFQ